MIKKFVVCVVTNLVDPIYLSSVIQTATAEEAVGTVIMSLFDKHKTNPDFKILGTKYVEV